MPNARPQGGRREVPVEAIGWAPCPEVAFGAECASIEVLLDPLDERSDVLAVSLARIAAAEQPARGQLWSVGGDAGTSAIAGLERAARVRDLAPDLDLVAIDHRGTGYSGRLGCPAEEGPGSLAGAGIAPQEWPACMATLPAQREILDQLTVTGAAVDLVVATSTLRGEGQEVYWWGTSYGTRVIQRALHVVPDLPTAVLLDGLVPADWTFSEHDAGVDAAGRGLLSACGADPSCADRFDAPPLEVAEAVIAAPRADCEALGFDRRGIQTLIGRMLAAGDPVSGAVPAVWLRLERCDRADRQALEHLLGALDEGDAGVAGPAPVMERHLAYAELWDRGGADVQDFEAALRGAVATLGVSVGLAVQAPDWPVVPPRDEWRGIWPATSVPVLALHGAQHPVVPLSRIGGFEQWLGGGTQQVVRVPYAEAAALDRGPCGAELVRQFLNDPDRPVDLACLVDQPRWDFDGDPAVTEALFGTDDRWGDARGCGCGGSTGGGWLGALVAAGSLRGRRRPA